MATTQQAVRRWIMTGGVAAVTITGTIYGATLKEDVTVQKVCHDLFYDCLHSSAGLYSHQAHDQSLRCSL